MAMTAPVSRSKTIHADAVLVGTSNPVAFVIPQLPNSLSTVGRGAIEVWPGASFSEVVSADGGVVALSHLSVFGAEERGAGSANTGAMVALSAVGESVAVMAVSAMRVFGTRFILMMVPWLKV